MSEISFINHINDGKNVKIFIKPSFMNLENSEFSDGIIIFEEPVEFNEHQKFIKALNSFFDYLLEDYFETLVDSPDYFNFSKEFHNSQTFGSFESRWSNIYWDLCLDDEKGDRLLPYIRFIPDFVSLEYAGFSHGISVFNRFFETDKDAEEYCIKLENFMNQMILDLEKHLKNKKLD